MATSSQWKATLLVTGRYLRDEYFGTYFSRATNLRAELRRQVDEALGQHDALVTPTTPMKAFRLLDHNVTMTEVVRERAASMRVEAAEAHLRQVGRISNEMGARLGHWAIGQGVLCFIIGGGAWLGLQLIGPRFGEADLLCLGHLYERLRGPMPDA